MSPMRDKQPNKRTTEDRATQPMEAGGWVSQYDVMLFTEVEKIEHFPRVKHCGGTECRNTHSSKVEAQAEYPSELKGRCIRQKWRAGKSARTLESVRAENISKKLPFVKCPPWLFRSNVTVFAQLKRLYVLNTNYKAWICVGVFAFPSMKKAAAWYSLKCFSSCCACAVWR